MNKTHFIEGAKNKISYYSYLFRKTQYFCCFSPPIWTSFWVGDTQVPAIFKKIQQNKFKDFLPVPPFGGFLVVLAPKTLEQNDSIQSDHFPAKKNMTKIAYMIPITRSSIRG